MAVRDASWSPGERQEMMAKFSDMAKKTVTANEAHLKVNPYLKATDYPLVLQSSRYRIWAKAVCASYQSLIGEPMSQALDAVPAADLPLALFDAPFVLLSHGVEADPIFCFGNRLALKLFGYDWEAFTSLPSRLSAEPDLRTVREQLLMQVRQKGFISDYAGVRIAADGRRFEIQQATVWNVFDSIGERIGQAACFSAWLPVSSCRARR